MSFWCPWGSFGDPGRPRGPPQGDGSKKRRKREFADPPPGSLLGTLGRPWAPSGRHFLRFWVSGRRSGRRSPFRWPKRAAQEVPETPSSHETEGFAYTKTSFSHFHPYLDNDGKWGPMGALLGRFSDVLETLGAEKSQKLLPEGVLGSEKVDVKKNMKKRRRKAVREIPSLGVGCPKTIPQSTSHGPVRHLMNTPLRASGHGGGYYTIPQHAMPSSLRCSTPFDYAIRRCAILCCTIL